MMGIVQQLSETSGVCEEKEDWEQLYLYVTWLSRQFFNPYKLKPSVKTSRVLTLSVYMMIVSN